MKIYRYEVPADDAWHDVTLTGPVIHVAGHFRDIATVHFWVRAGSSPPYTARLRVYGTGHEIPPGAVYRGTAIIEPLVWHLFEQAGN